MLVPHRQMVVVSQRKPSPNGTVLPVAVLRSRSVSERKREENAAVMGNIAAYGSCFAAGELTVSLDSGESSYGCFSSTGAMIFDACWRL